MNYREEIETALNRDGKQYGKVWRGETEDMSESDSIASGNSSM